MGYILCQLGILCMPPLRQGWPHSTVKNNPNNSSLCGSLHLTTHALSHWSFSEVFRLQPLFSFRAEEAEVCWGQWECLRSFRESGTGCQASPSQPRLLCCGVFRGGAGAAGEVQGVRAHGCGWWRTSPSLCLISDGPSAMSPRRIIL